MSDPSYYLGAIVLAPLLLWSGFKYLNHVILAKTTCLVDLQHLGEPTSSKYRGRAVVCGGSLAGLITARMLTDHFDEVVVIEPETSDANGFRKGNNVMQFNHVHGYGPLNMIAWRKFWPDIVEEILKSDGRGSMFDLKMHYGYPVKRVPQDFKWDAATMTRRLVEAIIRRMTRRSERIRFIEGSVKGLIQDISTADKLKGIKYVAATNTAEELELEASFVIDATGQYCRGVKWLTDLGYEPPLREFYDPRGAYCSAYVKLTPEMLEQVPWPISYNRMAWIQTAPCEPDFSTRGTYMSRYDGDTIAILAMTFNDLEELPRTAAEVYDWARSCKMDPWVYELVNILQDKNAEIEMYRTKLGQFYYMRYDKLKRHPTNFLPIGDSAMKLNPVYGQGGSKIIDEVAALDALLRAGRKQSAPYYYLPKNVPSRFYKKTALRKDLMLDVGKAIDYRWEGTERTVGDSPNYGAFLFYWWRQVGTAGMVSSNAAAALSEAAGAVAPPTVLFGWGVLWPLLLYKLGIIHPSQDRGSWEERPFV